MHGNTHLPVVVGLQQRYELTGEEDFRAMVRLPTCTTPVCPIRSLTLRMHDATSMSAYRRMLMQSMC